MHLLPGDPFKPVKARQPCESPVEIATRLCKELHNTITVLENSLHCLRKTYTKLKAMED